MSTTIPVPSRLDGPPAQRTPDDTERMLATLVVAFAADPVIRWLYPSGAQYLTAFPDLVRVLSADALADGAADRNDDVTGVALWVRPGTEVPEDELVALLQRSVDPARHEVAFAFLEQVATCHPTEPHWYLPFIGVDPRRQGAGEGSDLLRRGTARCERDGLPAYLEASSARNRELYARHGFEVVGEIAAGDSPPLWPMWRPCGSA